MMAKYIHDESTWVAGFILRWSTRPIPCTKGNGTCLTAAGPNLWNRLPANDPRQMDISYEQFKQLLETHLFGR